MPQDLPFTYRLPADVVARISAVPVIGPQAPPRRQELPAARAEEAEGG